MKSSEEKVTAAVVLSSRCELVLVLVVAVPLMKKTQELLRTSYQAKHQQRKCTS